VQLKLTGKIAGPTDPTVLAIRNFQRKQFNFADGVVDPDHKTERRLIALGGGKTPRVLESDTFTVVPFNEPAPFLISRELDDRRKGDLDAGPRPSLAHLPPTVQEALVGSRLQPTPVLESRMMAELRAGGPLATNMGNLFIRQNAGGGVVTFALGSPLSNAVKTSKAFSAAHQGVRARITQALKASIRERREVDFRDLAEPKKVVEPPVFGFSLREDRSLKIAIGSLQGAEVFLKSFSASVTPRRWQARLIYILFDHFGVDDKDTIPDANLHGSQGQQAMWVLQHERHPGHFPFVSKIIVEADVEDRL
jgi:hypothetical protein